METRNLQQLNDKLNQKIERFISFHDLTEALSQIRRSKDLYRRIVDIASELTEAQRASCLLLNQESGGLTPIAVKGCNPFHFGNEPCRPEENVIGKVAKDGVPILVTRIGKHAKPDCGSFICIPIKIKDETLAVLNVADKRDDRAFTEEDLFLLHLLAKKAALIIENLALYENMTQNLHATLRTLVSTIEAKDMYTQQHSKRVTELAIRIAGELGCPSEDISILKFAGYLHDIGKIGIKDYILMKPGKLTPKEWKEIKSHPVIGENIIKHLGCMSREEAIVRHHHERWDGRGYPDSLRGEQIPFIARILFVADSFDAMTSERPYRKAKSISDTVKELKVERNKQFDGRVVDTFLSLLKKDFCFCLMGKRSKNRHEIRC